MKHWNVQFHLNWGAVLEYFDSIPDVVVYSEWQKCGLKYVIETSSKLVRTSPINDGDSLSQKVSISVLVIKKNECKISLIFKNNKYCIFWIKFMFNIILYHNKRLL